jgi:hypothetical protein
MNHTKHKDELDKGKAGRSDRLWLSISEAYNDSTNNKQFGEFAFIEDKQIAQFASQFDLSTYFKLDWVKASHWFKEMVTDYDAAMILFTKSGTHSPTFYGYCRNKAETFYYRLYIKSKPDSHKSFGVVLSQEIFSASSVDNINASATPPRASRVAVSMKKKEEAVSRIAESMTAMMVENQNRNSRCSEKMQLERDTGTFYMNIATLPTGARGDAARNFMSDSILTKSEHIQDITKWFEEYPSP